MFTIIMYVPLQQYEHFKTFFAKQTVRILVLTMYRILFTKNTQHTLTILMNPAYLFSYLPADEVFCNFLQSVQNLKDPQLLLHLKTISFILIWFYRICPQQQPRILLRLECSEKQFIVVYIVINETNLWTKNSQNSSFLSEQGLKK